MSVKSDAVMSWSLVDRVNVLLPSVIWPSGMLSVEFCSAIRTSAVEACMLASWRGLTCTRTAGLREPLRKTLATPSTCESLPTKTRSAKR